MRAEEEREFGHRICHIKGFFIVILFPFLLSLGYARFKQTDIAQHYVNLKCSRSEFPGDLQRQLCLKGPLEQFREALRVKAEKDVLWSSYIACSLLRDKCPAGDWETGSK